MKRPRFETVEQPSPSTILLIDKEGIITAGVLPLLPKETQVMVLGLHKPEGVEGLGLEYIHFGNTMPQIPDAYYSHMFVVYNGEKDVLMLLPQFLEKARLDGSKIFFIVDLFFADGAFLQELTYSYRNAHVLVTGDFFGETIELDSAKTIHRFFDEANTKGTIAVSGDGLTQTFPVLFEDAMAEIAQSAFLPKNGKIHYLFPKHSPTEISLARMFQSINPFIRITFVDPKIHAAEGMENSQKSQNINASGVSVLQSNYPLLKKIKDAALLSTENIADKPPEIAVKKEPVEKVIPRYHIHLKKKKPSSPLPYAFLFLILLFVLPFLLTLFFAGLGSLGLLGAKQSLLSGDFPKAAQSASFAQTFFGLSQTTGTVVSMEAKLLGMKAQGDKLTKTLTLGEEGSYALRNVISAAQTVVNIFYKNSATPKEDFIAASNKVKKAVTIFQKVRAEENIPGVSDLDGIVTLIGATIDSYPTLLGMDEKKSYLLLFQNNAELRPGGGFIGSYGLLTLHNGSVSNFEIHDVYDADGQLTGHVEPAYPFRRYMGVVHQYLRDSNYAPDFPSSASSSANMLYMETNKTVSGVIGVDVSFVKTLVGALGPLYVPDYKEEVTSENFYMLTQSHAEKDFFPGSTQKKDFLRSLFNAIQLKLVDKKSLPYLALAKAVEQGISEKHILFAFPDPSIDHLFSVNNLSGSLLDSRSESLTQYNDVLGISEANIGANKANAFVYRKVDQKVSVETDGTIKNTVTIRFKNESKDWPGGDYKNYMRLITPKGSVLSGITIDGQQQSITPAITDYLLYERPDFTPPPGLEVETHDEWGKTLFGFLVIIPKGSFKTITVSYSSPTAFAFNQQNFSYDLWYIKQQGTDAYQYSFVFSIPQNYKAFRVSKALSIIGNSIVLDKTISTDQKLHLELTKQ